MSGELMPRASVEQIVDFRNRALALYEEAYLSISQAHEAITAAHAMAQRAAPLSTNNYNYDRIDEVNRFYSAVQLPDASEFLRVARQITDLRCWSHIVSVTDMERLMDVQAKEQLRQQMRYVAPRSRHDGELIDEDEIARGMPEITAENIYATLDGFRADAGMIFRRGIANAFSKLDRRFKSHDGFKIGSRVIVTRMFNEHGSLQWGSTRDTLIDIERVFAILDGQSESSFQSTLGMLESRRDGHYGPKQSYHENEYLRVRCFMNGNAHLWFRRDDLVCKVNKLLAEYYGEVVGDGMQAEDDPLENRKTTPAKRFGFYPTPPAAVDELFSNRGWGNVSLCVLRRKEDERLRILEPSAGTGNLARRCINTVQELDEWSGGRARYQDEYRFDNIVDCVEIQPELATGLRNEGIYNRVICGDFLAIRPQGLEPYDLIVMNPPFDLERDIDHVTHALKFLKPGGTLHAIMSAGTEFRETKKAIAFRALVESMGGRFTDMPAGSFAEVGTYVNTVILRLRSKP